MDEETKKLALANGPTNQIHTFEHSESQDEQAKREENYIRDKVPFKGNWRTAIDKDNRLLIPTPYHQLLADGGVITTSADKHLLLFGRVHWQRFQRLLAKEIGFSPDHTAIGRHFYKHMLEFDRLDEDGGITLNKQLVSYAGLKNTVAMIGLVYFAEIYSEVDYQDSALTRRDIAELIRALA